MSDTLEQCSAFWDDVDLTLEVVKRFRDQSSVLLKGSAKSERQTKRLYQRLADYGAFWEELKKQCDSFVEGSSKAGENMRKFVAIFNKSVVKSDAAASFIAANLPEQKLASQSSSESL